MEVLFLNLKKNYYSVNILDQSFSNEEPRLPMKPFAVIQESREETKNNINFMAEGIHNR